MNDSPQRAAITIRAAVAEDAEGIARVYMESAEHHAGLDPERYWLPEPEAITARYRKRHSPAPQPKAGHPAPVAGEAITLVGELGGELVGFVDAELFRSPDPMLREDLYCHIVEIAVSSRRRSQGIGERLLRAAEDWGRGQGAQFASLEYLAANTRAGEFYQRRMGYRVAGYMAVKPL